MTDSDRTDRTNVLPLFKPAPSLHLSAPYGSVVPSVDGSAGPSVPSASVGADGPSVPVSASSVPADGSSVPARQVLEGTIVAPSRRVSLPGVRTVGDVPSWVRAQALHAADRSAAYALHAPVVVVHLALRSPVGLWRAVRVAVAWTADTEGSARHRPAATSPGEHIAMRRDHASRIRFRLQVVGVATLGAAGGAWWAAGAVPGWQAGAAGAVAVMAAGIAGRSTETPLREVLIAPAAPAGRAAFVLTDRIVWSAVEAMRLPGWEAWARSTEDPGRLLAAPVIREGHGWRADVDLPVATASAAMVRREEVSRALRRPVGCVWLDTAPGEHGGRLVMRVLDEDFSTTPPPAWPLARSGQHDYFRAYPFGWDVRGRLISLPLFENNLLIAAIPGQGKSATARVAMSAAALDPSVEMRIWELSGKGDFEDLQELCTTYVNGLDNTSIRSCAEGVAALKKECEDRLMEFGKIPKSMRPDKKLTREIVEDPRYAAIFSPLVVLIDEIQNALGHSTYGAQIAADLEVIVRMTRAIGVTLIMATQRPTADTMPTNIRDNVSIRFALKVADGTSSDLILGKGMSSAGYSAGVFRLFVDRGIGYLIGGEGMPLPTVVRSAYLDGPATARIAERARALREAAGTIPTEAAEDTDPEAPWRDLLAVRAVWPQGRARVWSETLGELVAQADPTRSGWGKIQVRAAMSARGVEEIRSVRGTAPDGSTSVRSGYALADLDAVLTARHRGTGV